MVVSFIVGMNDKTGAVEDGSVVHRGYERQNRSGGESSVVHWVMNDKTGAVEESSVVHRGYERQNRSSGRE
ncbi:hypothetical protein [Metabacillus litoralis]|uniref:hypothetical protein n=2 Tax=Metabacillus litoralis TaxID=152268 RepID=UPI00204121F9|nr:hypothetical protein [Metabacillus litoralis]MCM3409888.1 hypothetical protein [Metabacillus litoralis]